MLPSSSVPGFDSYLSSVAGIESQTQQTYRLTQDWYFIGTNFGCSFVEDIILRCEVKIGPLLA